MRTPYVNSTPPEDHSMTPPHLSRRIESLPLVQTRLISQCTWTTFVLHSHRANALGPDCFLIVVGSFVRVNTCTPGTRATVLRQIGRPLRRCNQQCGFL